ncbi:MAG: mannosyl-3-phosphoglycerate phosphatase-related protein [Pleurocapsa sp.]
MRYIVVTDLDGTLLDHQTYDFTPALNAIARLKKQEIPVIFNSSKTQAEISQLRDELHNREPFVCENGGVLCVEDKREYLGVPRSEFLGSLEIIKQQLHLNYESFAEATVEDVVRWTSLSKADAIKAMKREATEPLLWHDTEGKLDTFRQQLQGLKLQCVKGGRFYHVMGTFNKASCFDKLKAYYAQRWQEEIKIVALGDSQNDLPMLEQADFAIVIPAHGGNTLKLKRDNVFFATQPAPQGWQEGISFFLEKRS